MGSFEDSGSVYRLNLWQDAKGVFGEFLSPVLDADSPTSRLYRARLEPETGALTFSVRFPRAQPSQWSFAGTIRGRSLAGELRRGSRSEAIELRRVPDDLGMGISGPLYTSRAQFECAMTLFDRY